MKYNYWVNTFVIDNAHQLITEKGKRQSENDSTFSGDSCSLIPEMVILLCTIMVPFLDFT